MFETYGDNRFDIIEAAKKDLIESTNIEGNPSEMIVLDDFLYRAWQMGWLDSYDMEGKTLMDCYSRNCPFRVNETSNIYRCECLACPPE